jgi:hypothetical protein
MKRTYHIKEQVRGELHLGPGPDATVFSFTPGDHTPADAVDLAILEHLVSIGAATLNAPTKAMKETKK